ncbi:unnamed protein product [Schistosoma bovis]|nr:unnamed protein product [Schistosoma bovis]
MDNSNSIMQQRRSSIKLYTEFSQNYPVVHNLPIQIDNSSHSIRSIIIPSMIMQSTGIQTMNMTPEKLIIINNNPPILLDATSESSVNIENSTDPLSTLRIYLLNQLPISVLFDDASIKKLQSCSICMENYHIGDRIMGLPCFHMFHYTCLYAWIDKVIR